MPGARRHLGHAQMAFVRCWAEGLDLQGAWARYLDVDGPADPRRARRELQRLRDELGGLARAHGQPRVAALLRRDPEAIAEAHPTVPTLEVFRAQQPPDFYTDAELVALYEAEFGTAVAGPARRRQRLRERLVLALHWLEGLAVRDPQPTDPLAAWLDERMAARLAAAGMHRIDALMAHITACGFHWHRGIGRVGPAGAARVLRWLQAHEPTLGALPRASCLPPSQLDAAAAPATAIVPLERFAAPAGRDGSNGSNRAPRADCRVAADHDLAAVQAWLARRVSGSHTWRAYRKEAERFLLWAVLERGKAMSSLTAADCEAYRDFLAAPGPHWTGPRNARRQGEAWRPFEAALAARSAATAVTILRSMCTWLVEQHYLAANPWEKSAVRARGATTPAPLRALSTREWDGVQRWLATLPPSPAARRLRFMLDFGHATGLRLSELAAARFGWWQRMPQADAGSGWWVDVPGRAARCRRIPTAWGWPRATAWPPWPGTATAISRSISAVSGMRRGSCIRSTRVCFPNRLHYIVNHAEDQLSVFRFDFLAAWSKGV